MKTRHIITPIAATAVAVIAVCVCNWLMDNRLPGFSERTELFIYPDTPVAEILDSLIANAGAKWPGRLPKVFGKHQVATYCKPGHYVVEPGHTAVYVARMLNNGWQTPVKLVLSGTLRRRDEIARKISLQMMVDSAEVRNAMDDREFLKEFGFVPENVFALFVPDTYEMYWTASVKDIFSKQNEAYRAFWTEENKAKASKLGLTQMEVSVLASIVSGETHFVPEMPKIAGVYLNRLKRGMKLQADPTIAFCYDYQVNRILRRMLTVDSPYNTYRYAGLPPAPIYVPTRNTLDAVLNPDFGGGNLYFCADPSFDGSHRFARTYGEHLKNARAFQRALNARGRNK